MVGGGAQVDIEERQVALGIARGAENLLAGKAVAKDRHGQPAVDRHEDGLIVLVAILVEHEQDLAQLGQHAVDDASAQVVRVGQRDIGRDQRFGHAAADAHGIERQPP